MSLIRLRQSGCVAVCLSIFLLPLSVRGELPDSGQLLCDNGVNTLVTCDNTSTGDAAVMPRQDARYGRDPAAGAAQLTKTGGGAAGFDYTKLDSVGAPIANQADAYATTPWDCVQDHASGLMWEVKANSGLRSNLYTYTWYDSNNAENGGDAGLIDTGVGVGSDNCLNNARCDTEQFIADVNAANLCGYNDWRLPSKRELNTIVHAGASNPAIDANYFPNTQSGNYWSLNTNVSATPQAWAVEFAQGRDASGLLKSSAQFIRLVRGASF